MSLYLCCLLAWQCLWEQQRLTCHLVVRASRPVIPGAKTSSGLLQGHWTSSVTLASAPHASDRVMGAHTPPQGRYHLRWQRGYGDIDVGGDTAVGAGLEVLYASHLWGAWGPARPASPQWGAGALLSYLSPWEAGSTVGCPRAPLVAGGRETHSHS